MIVRATGVVVNTYIFRGGSDGRREIPTIDVSFVDPCNGRSKKMSVSVSDEEFRGYSKGDTVKIRINTSIFFIFRFWVLVARSVSF
jgi:hypothetical protein